MRKRFDRFTALVLGAHGLYFILTGLWAIIDLESFNTIVGHAHEGLGFEMHSIAALAIVLGIAFLYAAQNLPQRLPFVVLAISVNLAVIIPELYYLPKMGWNLFWLDLVEESIVALILLFYLFNATHK